MVIERDFLDHWKTQLLARLLKVSTDSAAVILIRLWAHCEARRTGSFADLSADALAGICRWPGNSQKFDKAMQEARWIVREIESAAQSLTVHQWEERNARLLTAIQNGKKGGRPKVNPSVTPDEPGNNPSVSSGLSKTDSGLTQSNPSVTSKGRVGKGREEYPQSPPSGEVDEPSNPDIPSGLGALEDTIAFVLGIFGKKRKLGYEAETAIGRQAEFLPLTPDQKRLLAWFYKLPPDPTDIALRSRRTDADKLACNLFPELDRAEIHAKKIGAPDFGPQKNKAPAVPEGWREWFAKKYPRAVMPAAWSDLDGRLQMEFDTDSREAAQ